MSNSRNIFDLSDYNNPELNGKKVIPVNKWVHVSSDYEFGLGLDINIYAIDDSKDGFIQLVASMDDFQQCCETFDIESSPNLFGKDFFVDYIEVSADSSGDSFNVSLFLKNGTVKSACLYNNHNGFYYHDIQAAIDTDGSQYFIYDN